MKERDLLTKTRYNGHRKEVVDVPLLNIWRYDPTRLADRLVKYNGGQIELLTREGLFRGPINTIRPSKMQVSIEVLWLAYKKRVFGQHWRKEWKWVLVPRSELVSLCNLHIEIAGKTSSGREATSWREENPDESKLVPMVKELEIQKFYQNKRGFISRHPKQMFFVTLTGEKGVLFQKDDPRNISLKDGEIIDPKNGEEREREKN